MSARIEGLLRVAALIIAALALIDPTLTFASRQRPIVAVSLVERPSLARPIAGNETGLDRVRRVRAQLTTALADTFDVREGPAPDAAAQVLIGDGSFPADTPLVAPLSADSASGGTAARAVRNDDARSRVRGGASGEARVPIYGVEIDTTVLPNVRVLRVEAPRRAQLTSPLHVTAIVEARGMVGRTSAITLRADDLDVARAAQAWTQPVETASIALDALPFRTGLTRLTVAVDPMPAEATTADNTADTAIDVTNEKLAVLFVDARPSWMTRFARQALDADDRFAIKTLSRVSRGVTTATPETPQALTLASLEPFAVVIVGAPEALTRADVDALRQFARVRGGVVIFAPDQPPSGAYLDLLPARAFDAKIQDQGEPRQPRAIHLNLAADTAVAATELALPRELLPGSDVLGRLGDPRTGAPVIIASPAGDGEVVFIGTLDAWRYRAIPKNGFDATWRQLIATRGSRAPVPIDVTLDTPIAAPDRPVAIRVRLRKTMLANESDGRVPPLTAAFEHRLASGQSAPGEPIRLWPADQAGRFVGRLNAPSRPGVYAVSVGFDRGTPQGRAMLLVASPAPVAAVTWDGLRTFVDAHGGRLFPAADIPRLIEDLQQHVHAGTTTRARQPFRSAWWIAPFAACLGGEWWLRRRRGQR